MSVSSGADDRLWTVDDLSVFLGIPVPTLYRCRTHRGPPSHRRGRHLRYLREEKITFEDLTHWVSRLSLSALGPSGIRQCVFVISAALDHAVRSGRIRSNPARGLGLPRPKRRDYVYLNHGQVLALAAEAGRGRLLILLLAYPGLRWGEATALRVCDIDFERRRVDVRRAFSDVGGRVILGTPKSHQSRTVPLPRFLAVEIAAVVAGKHADQLVFTMPGGGVMRMTNWRRSVFLSARRRASDVVTRLHQPKGCCTHFCCIQRPA